VGAGSDTLTGFENLTGSQFNDTLTGSAGANTIIGGSGNDKIAGAGGADTLTGGVGADIFILKATADSAPGLADFITDFLAGTDKIDLSLIDSNSVLSGNQAFLFGGHNSNAVANSVTWYESGGNTIVQADFNGNTTADVQILLNGLNLDLHGTDFLL